MTKYELARDKRITMAAVVFEIGFVVACALLADSVLETVFKIPLIFAEPVPWVASLAVVLLLQYAILATELVARFRSEPRQWTLPLALLPGGLVVRTLLMLLAETIVILAKLLGYFFSVLLEFIFQLTRLDKKLGTAHVVDTMDRCLEPIEIAVNRLYNRLYFHKIQANTSVFTAIFNGSLSFWCINH